MHAFITVVAIAIHCPQRDPHVSDASLPTLFRVASPVPCKPINLRMLKQVRNSDFHNSTLTDRTLKRILFPALRWFPGQDFEVH